MSTISSPGLGSGLDVSGLVRQLVSAERAPSEARLNREQARANSQISALAKLQGALASLDSFLGDISSRLAPRSASVGNEEVFTATVTNGAPAGSYNIEVMQLASSQRLVGNAVAGADTVIGSGTLTLAIGDASFDVNFDSAATLDEIRDAINTHADNTGVTATIVTGSDGAHLVLNAAESGAANTLRVTQAGGDGGLAALTYDVAGGDTANYTEASPALDAEVRIDGIAVSAKGNVIREALEGISLNLESAKPGETIELVISRDVTALESALKEFVTNYNAVVVTIADQTRFNIDAGTAAALTGDAMTRGIAAGLRTVLSTATEGAPELADTLAELGITTQSDGRLKLDSATLNKTLEAAPEAAAQLFEGEAGLAARLQESLKGYIESEGLFDSRTEALKNRLDQVAQQRDQLDLRMERLQQTYLKQFTALDTLLTQMQSTSSYLAQQLANL